MRIARALVPRSFAVLCLCACSFSSAACTPEPPQESAPTGSTVQTGSTAPTQSTAQHQGGAARELFDGRTLAGWEGDLRFWSVEQGEICGRSTAELPLERTTWLRWTEGELRDFELTLEYRLPSGNSGVQFRSRVVGEYSVAGYQADLADGQGITGTLYDQFGRELLAGRGERCSVAESGKATRERFAPEESVATALRPGAWNELRILARGPRCEIWLNGTKSAELEDLSPLRASLSGCLALQLHVGAPMEVRFRNLRLTDLGGVHDAREHVDPQWIWTSRAAAPDEEAWFRKGIELAAAPRKATLYAVADDAFEVYLDGELVAAGEGTDRLQQVDVTAALRAGANALALWGKNRDGPGAVFLSLLVEVEGGRRFFGTDGSWQGARREPRDWTRSGDDPGWGPVHSFGPMGTEPWKRPENQVKHARLTALPGSEIRVPEGFVAELLYSVPRARQGSWVALCFDDQGRAYTSDEQGFLYRITLGSSTEALRVERVDVALGEAQGLCWAFDTLYVVVNEAKRFASGLYRVRDADGDDRLEHVELLRAFDGKGEHGPHAVVPWLDALYVVGGNEVAPPAEALAKWGPSFLPVGRLPVAVQNVEMTQFELAEKGYSGWIARTDKDGKSWDLVALGLRNAYDLAPWENGLYAFDSDMEWDLGMPWYVPTRLLEIHERADYGFRLGSARWPTWFPDSVGGVLDTGRSSPTGMQSGDALAFPENYRRALFAGDWLQGRILAFLPATHDEPVRMEVFASGKPLPVTDLASSQGALYFVTGGRHTQSGLYRIRARESLPPGPPAGGIFVDSPQVVRWLRNEARIELESQPVEDWIGLVAAEPDARFRGELELALARVGPPGRVAELLVRLAARPLVPAEREVTGLALRTLELALLRAAPVAPETRAQLAATLLAVFPCGDQEHDRQLGVLLASLPEAATDFVPRALDLLAKASAAGDGAEAFHWAFVLRGVTGGWSEAGRRQYFIWLREADVSFGGGRAVSVFLEGVRRDALALLGAEERAALGELVEPGVESDLAPPSARPFVRAWTRAELEPELVHLDEPRDLGRGARLLREASCLTCHRIQGRGQALGPELDGLAGRFRAEDLLESLLEPSREVPERYRDTLITTRDERLFVGRIVSQDGEALFLRDAYGTHAIERIPRAEIALQEASPLSPMPEGLLDCLTRDEILDLLAYLLQ